VHLVSFITKKFVTMHGHMSRCTVTCHDARSHVTMHGHMNVKEPFCKQGGRFYKFAHKK